MSEAVRTRKNVLCGWSTRKHKGSLQMVMSAYFLSILTSFVAFTLYFISQNPELAVWQQWFLLMNMSDDKNSEDLVKKKF